MSDVKIRIEGIEPLLAKIKSLKELSAVASAVKLGAVHLQGKLRQYPPEHHEPQPFKSDKQRRYFFWALKQGKIEVPYRRGISPGSRNLKQSWTVRTENRGLTAEVGTNAPYARLVQDRERQSAYHKRGGWPTVQDVMESEGELVTQYIHEAIQRELSE